MNELATQLLILRIIEISGVVIVAVILLIKWLSAKRLRKVIEKLEDF